MQRENSKVRVVALNERRDIYMVLDERGYSIGTGTKEVCEFLAELITRPPSIHRFDPRRSLLRDMGTSNIRSAISI